MSVDIITYEDAVAVGTFLARTVEYRLAWEDFDAGRYPEYDTVNRLFVEKTDAFDRMGSNARWFLDDFGELLGILRMGFKAMTKEGAELIGCVG